MTPTAAAPPWKSRIVGTGDEAPEALIANERNWRTHPKAQREAIAGVLDEVGYVATVLVNRRTGRLVDGHLRVDLARARGEASVPVTYVDLSEEEERLVLASLDPLAAMAGTDDEQLRALLESVTVTSDALADMLAALMPPPTKEGLTDPDDVPEPPDAATTQPGDLWLLGDHRLLCGDATDGADVARLIGAATVGLMVTDPPYGVDYDPTWRAHGHAARKGAVRNDDRADWSAAWELSPATVGYVWHGGLHAGVVADGLTAAGYGLRAQIIWVKPSLVMGRGDYHWQHEPCWYVVKEGRPARRTSDRTPSTVWKMDNVRAMVSLDDDEATEHGAQKPVEAMRRPMENHAPMAVYDPFVGSGTTIIAAEQLGRRCYAMEIDPLYCDVVVSRWSSFTGREARRG